MVELFVGGNQVGTLADAETLIPKFAAQRVAVEFRDDAGAKLGTFTPVAEPICPWEPDLTQEELDRRAAEPLGKPLAEILERLGAE